MASVALTFVTAKEGMHAVSFNMSDNDLNRVYDAYKSLYMAIDEDKLNAGIPDDDMHDPKHVQEAHYDMKTVFERLSDEMIYQAVLKVKQIEIEKAIEKANVQLIDIKV